MCIQRGLGFPQQGQRPWLCISPVAGEEGKGSAGISDITPHPGPPPQPSLVSPQLLPGDSVGNSLLPAPPCPHWCSSTGTIPIRGRSSVADPWTSAPVGSAGSALRHLTELLPPHCSQDGNPSCSPKHTEYPQALKGKTPSWLTLRVRERLDEKPGQTGIQCCRERWLGVAAVCCGFQAAP